MTGVRLIANYGLNSASADLPIWRADPLLADGSLVLFDSRYCLPSLLSPPGDLDTLHNIAWAEAAALIGSGDVSSLRSVFHDNHQSADALFEVTGQGGLHSIYSQVNNTNNNRGAHIFPADAISIYLTNNADHSYYLSQWQQITRQRATGSYYGYASISQREPATTGVLMRMDSLGVFPSSGALLGATAIPETNAVGTPIFRAMAVDGWTNGDPTPGTTTSIRPALAQMGNALNWQIAATNKSPSQILYRVYLEDLTVSGRTFEEAEAIDRALWTAAFAAGGRYYSDTFTNPSTFP